MKINEILESPFEIMSEANDSEVDGKNVLARVRGLGFRTNSASRNKRFYSHELWSTAIERNNKRLNDRMILGYLGHGTDNSDEGLAHAALVLTKMEINPAESGKESDGIIEYLVLGTPEGQALNALLRAKVKLGVSSRATGTSTGKDRLGNEMLSAETYNLHGFDIVQNTGVAGAIPNLIESQEGADAPHKGVSTVSDITIKKEHYEQLVSSKASLEAKLESAVNASNEFDAAHEAELKELAAKHEAASKEDAVLIEAYKAIGSVEEVNVLVDQLETYIGACPIETIKEALEAAEAYKDLGSAEDVTSCMDKLEAYVTIGTAEQFEKLQKGAGHHESVVFAKEHGCSEELAESLLSRMEAKEAIEVLATIPSASSDLGERYRHSNEGEASDHKNNQHESLARSLV